LLVRLGTVGIPIRRCVTCVSPHLIIVVFVPTASATFPCLATGLPADLVILH
jgi:hypothetical protein